MASQMQVSIPPNTARNHSLWLQSCYTLYLFALPGEEKSLSMVGCGWDQCHTQQSMYDSTNVLQVHKTKFVQLGLHHVASYNFLRSC
jgi:hypothetical protein